MLQRRRARMTGTVFVNHAEGQADMTIQELDELLRSGNSAIPKRLSYFGSQLRGTAAWKRARRGELLDLMDEIGLPHFFLTWSAADVQWDMLQRLLTAAETDGQAGTNVDDTGRNRRVNDNPALVGAFFVKRIEIFMGTIGKHGMGVKEFWVIFEWQGRGSIHAHGVVWLRDGMCPVDDVEAVIRDPHREEERQALLDFYDEYCSAWNPIGWTRDILGRMLQRPDEHPEMANPPLPLPPDLIHPCRRQFPQDDPGDLAVLANFCNRHKHCSPQTCLKRRGGEWKCKAGAPWQLCTHSTFTDEGRKPGDIAYRPARNDPLMNPYPIKADAYQCWRANMDIKPILSRHAMVQYLTKYCTKHETPSDALQDAVRNVMGRDACRSVHAFSKALVASVGDRDFTAQEVTHHLLGLPGFICSQTFQVASLSGMRKWNVEGESVQKSIWEIYIERPDTCEDVSFHTFVARWHLDRGQYREREKPVIPRIFPRIYCNSSSDDKFETWCKHQLRVHMPCRSEANLLEGRQSWVVALIDAIRQGRMPARVVAEYSRLTANAADHDEASDKSSDIDAPEEHPPRDDFMKAGDINPEYEEDAQAAQGPPFDPLEYWTMLKQDHHMADAALRDAAGFIKECKQHFKLPAVDYSDADASRLNARQRLAFVPLQKAVDDAVGTLPTATPTRMLIAGTAGTGKSFIIKCLMKYAHDRHDAEVVSRAIQLVAPTGTAAFNINGRTIHSLLALPVPLSNDLPELSPAALANLQERLDGLRLLVVDEMSMIGRRFLGALDSRLREVFPERRDEWFGGVSVALMGDFGQLPPVMDLPMYSLLPGQGLSHVGQATFAAFNQGVVLEKVERVAGDSPEQQHFRGLLSRLRNGEVTPDDWTTLMTRSVHQMSMEEQAGFKDVLMLTSTHAAEAQLNEDALRRLGVPIARMEAVNSGPGAQTLKAEDAGGLQNILRLAAGSRVMLRQNLWVEAGLTNGALGKVLGILFDPDGSQPPALPVAVLVQFDAYNGPSYLQNTPRVVPIPASTHNWMKDAKSCSRTQLPLCLAFATTIHKSQGWTRKQVSLDIGTSEHSLGITFVACSRVQALGGLCFNPTDLRACQWSRFRKINEAKGHVDRRRIDAKLQQMHADLADTFSTE